MGKKGLLKLEMYDLVIYYRNLNEIIRIVRKSIFLYLINTNAKKMILTIY